MGYLTYNWLFKKPFLNLSTYKQIQGDVLPKIQGDVLPNQIQFILNCFSSTANGLDRLTAGSVLELLTKMPTVMKTPPLVLVEKGTPGCQKVAVLEEIGRISMRYGLVPEVEGTCLIAMKPSLLLPHLPPPHPSLAAWYRRSSCPYHVRRHMR